MGKYSELKDKIVRGEYEYCGNYKSLEVSLKVLDVLDENTSSLPVKQAIMILEDAKSILTQLVGIN